MHNIRQVWIFLAALNVVIAVILIAECISFKQQANVLVELQGEYQNYILALRSVLDDSSKEGLEGTESVALVGDEKKKAFLTVNRGSDYLKKSFELYLKEHSLESSGEACVERRATQSRTVRAVSARRRPAAQHRKRDLILLWPINQKKFWLSSYFGWRTSAVGRKFHYGLDLAALKGTPIYAAAPGVVKEAGVATGYGNTIVLNHGAKYATRYAHLNSIKVKVGRQVQRGDLIGTVGDSGTVRKKGKDASHLHFEVIEYGKRIDPLRVLP